MLEARAVSKEFRGRRGAAPVLAVREATLTAEPGRFIAIVGESGSGKSTLARMLLDLIPPTGGTVSLDGRDLARMSRAEKMRYRRTVQAVLQDPAGSLNPRKRVEEAIGEVVKLHRVASGRAGIRDAVTDALSLVGLDPPERYLARFPHELSGGQRQRVLIARAIALRPKIVVADEAVSALDASVKAGVLQVMADLTQRLDVGYVFITHDLPLVRKVADYVYVMKSGEIVEEGVTADLFSAPAHPYTRALLSAALAPV